MLHIAYLSARSSISHTRAMRFIHYGQEREIPREFCLTHAFNEIHHRGFVPAHVIKGPQGLLSRLGSVRLVLTDTLHSSQKVPHSAHFNIFTAFALNSCTQPIDHLVNSVFWYSSTKNHYLPKLRL